MTLWNSTFKSAGKPMQRKTPMKATKPMGRGSKKRGPGLAQRVAESQGTVIRPFRRPERSFRSVEHRRAVASLPCARCGVVGFSQAAHANAGKGLGLKTSDALTFPLCCSRPGVVGCHVLHDQGGIYTRQERARVEWESVDATRATLIRQNKWPAYVESAYLKAIVPLARMVHGDD
ncbi:hypothetical protein ACTPOE_16805 [Castellaniella sp. WN]